MKFTSTAADMKKRGTSFLVLSFAAALGILAGAFCVSRGFSADSPWLHQYFSCNDCIRKFAVIFRHSFLSSALFLAAAAVLGLSAVGQPAAAALLIYRGFGVGAATAAVYGASGFGAVSSVLTLIVPKSAALLTVSVLAVRESIRSSSEILYYLAIGEAPDRRTNELKLYIIRFAVLLLISTVISIGDALLNVLI